MLGELVVNWDEIEMRAKERKAFEFNSAIDRRLTKIEEILAELQRRG